jgi:hypothetical protein
VAVLRGTFIHKPCFCPKYGTRPPRQGSLTLFQKSSLPEKALPHYFDYREMANRSLGETWNSLNPSEIEEFVKDFGSLLKVLF